MGTKRPTYWIVSNFQSPLISQKSWILHWGKTNQFIVTIRGISSPNGRIDGRTQLLLKTPNTTFVLLKLSSLRVPEHTREMTAGEMTVSDFTHLTARQNLIATWTDIERFFKVFTFTPYRWKQSIYSVHYTKEDKLCVNRTRHLPSLVKVFPFSPLF